MASLESLNDRQRAVLQLLLRQGKSYDDLAGMLKMDTAGVRSRARGAVAAISPDAGDIGSDRRDEVADFLLGQQPAAQRAATLEYLDGSSAGRAWARAAADALRPIGGTLPDVPAERAVAADASGAPAAGQAQAKRSSQLGSRLLFAGLGVVVAVAIILAMSLGGDDGGQASTTPTAGLTTPTGDKLEVVAQGSLGPPNGSASKARGTVAIVRFPESGQYRFGLNATGLPPSSPRGSAYGVWLYTSDAKKRFLGFPDMTVAKDGKLQTVSDLPPDTPIYAAVLLTRETAESPKRPGRIVLAARMITAADVAQQRQRQQQQGRTQTQTTP